MKYILKTRVGSLNFISVVILGVLTSPASGAPLDMVTTNVGVGQAIETRLEVQQLGQILLKHGLVKLHGQGVTVLSVPDWLFDRHAVLSGKIVSSKFVGASGQSSIYGLTYFFEGDYLSHLDRTKVRDQITLTDGRVFSGRVLKVNDSSLTFQVLAGTLNVKDFQFAEIKLLDSPRAFFFTIPVSDVKLSEKSNCMKADAKSITFVPTTALRKTGWFSQRTVAVEPKSTLPGTEGGVTKRQIATLVMLDIINDMSPAVIAPIVGSYGSRGANKYLHQFNVQQSANGAPVFPY